MRDFDEDITLEGGSQGGQHFFVAAELTTPLKGRLQLEMEFLDSITGERTGAARWQEIVDGCGQVIEDIPVVLMRPVAQSGDLEARATLGECSWEFEVNDLGVAAPAPLKAGAGSSAADGSASDDPDGGP